MKIINVSGQRMVSLVLGRLGLCEIENIFIYGEKSVHVECRVKREEPFEPLLLMPLDNHPNFSDFRIEYCDDGTKTVSFYYNAVKYDRSNDCLTMSAKDYNCVVAMFFGILFGEETDMNIKIDSSKGFEEFIATIKPADNEPLEISRPSMRVLLMLYLNLEILSSKNGKYVIKIW